MSSAESAGVDLHALIGLFFDSPAPLGQFVPVTAADLPESSRQLLAHDGHMTVTLERCHRSSVDVVVLQHRTDGQHYSRKILLTRQSDGQVVQFGIVRLDLSVLSDEVQREIQSGQTPLGRVLIDHHVMRHVKLLELYRIEMGPELAAAFSRDPGQTVYGRTALLYCEGAPAIELLEIVDAKELP